jgi:hypothetical protein
MAFLGITRETMFFGFSQACPTGAMVLPSIRAMRAPTMLCATLSRSGLPPICPNGISDSSAPISSRLIARRLMISTGACLKIMLVVGSAK